MPRQIAISAAVTDIFSRYDRNRNGVIDLQPEKSKVADESRRRVTKEDALILSEAMEARKLFVAADKNGDRQVTREEVTAVLASFDQDGDGKLSQYMLGQTARKPAGEYDRFYAQYGERKASAEGLPKASPAPLPDAPTNESLFKKLVKLAAGK